MNTPEMEALFARTLLGDYEAEDAWTAVSELRQNGSREIFEYAAAWCASDDSINGRERQMSCASFGAHHRTNSKLSTFKIRVAEAALLGMDHDPPEWTAEDYEAALQDRFPNSV